MRVICGGEGGRNGKKGRKRKGGMGWFFCGENACEEPRVEGGD